MVTNEQIFNLLKTTSDEQKKQYEELKTEIARLKADVLEDIKFCKESYEKIQVESRIERQKLLNLERKVKKYNLIFYGLQFEESEVNEKVTDLINTILKVNCTKKDFRDIYYFGKKIGDKPRPVLVEVLYYSLKLEVLKHSFHLKGTGISVDNDYATEDYEKRKFLKEQLKLARDRKYNVKIKGLSLIVNGEKYSYEQLKQKIEDSYSKPNYEIEDILNSTTADFSTGQDQSKPSSNSTPTTPKTGDAKFVFVEPAVASLSTEEEKNRTNIVKQKIGAGGSKRPLEKESPDDTKFKRDKSQNRSKNKQKKV